jgi:hypothetical protein
MFPSTPQYLQVQPLQNERRAFGARRMFVTVAALFAIVATSIATSTDHADAARRVRRVGPDFNIVISPDAARVSGGQRAVFPVFVQAVRGFKSTPSFDIDNVPAYIDAEIVPLGTNRYQLELIVPTNAPASEGVYTLIARSGSRKRTALFRLAVNGPAQPPVTQPPVTQPPVTQPPVTQPTVPQAPQFNLRADQVERTATTGETVQFGLTVDRASGYQGPVTFTVTGAPAGMTANFAPNQTNASTNLYVSPGAATPTGRYILTVTATAGSTQVVAAVAITVTATGDFALIASPLTATITGVSKTTYRVDVGSGSNKPVVDFSVVGLPAGATAKFDPTSSKTSSNLLITTVATTPSGTFPLTITGKSGVYSRQFVVQLVVNNPTVTTIGATTTTIAPTTTTALPGSAGYGLRATPSRLDFTRPGRASLQIEVSPFGGFKGAVTLTAENLPAGVRLTSNVQGGNLTTLVFDSDVTAKAGTTNVRIVGTSGQLQASIDVAFVVV